MIITSVDEYNNLFQVQNLVPDSFLKKINSTNWLELPYNKIKEQSHWPRRNIPDHTLPWAKDWQHNIELVLTNIQQSTNIKLHPQLDTTWWVDEPGFTCSLHTDGELPASLQIFWIGQPNLGTTFYNYKNKDTARKQFEFVPNTGYIMINLPDSTGYRHLQWHGMLNPVPENSIRLTSYTWLHPVK